MSKIVLLDSGPLGILTNRNPTSVVVRCQAWASGLRRAGCRVIVPEVIDYEHRRELIRRGSTVGVRLLDALHIRFEYLPLTTAQMRLAADLWAHARDTGQPTAPDPALDIDMILCAQALSLNDPNTIVATGNAAHIGRFVPAADWATITP